MKKIWGGPAGKGGDCFGGSEKRFESLGKRALISAMGTQCEAGRALYWSWKRERVFSTPVFFETSGGSGSMNSTSGLGEIVNLRCRR